MSKLDRFKIDHSMLAEISRLAKLYNDESNLCMDAKAFLASCIMMGSCLEAILILVIYEHRDKVANIADISKKHLLEWNLSDLLKVAETLGWIPSQIDPKKGVLANESTTWASVAVLINDYRNFVHPGNFAQIAKGAIPDEKDAEQLLEVLKITADSLSRQTPATIKEDPQAVQ